MGEIDCRICGEPYDCTGGFHHSHTDLTWHEFFQFTRGLGCPCCQGYLDTPLTGEGMWERTNNWARSMSNCSDETVPYEGFYEQIKTRWQTGQWRDEPPSLMELAKHSELACLDKDRLYTREDEHGDALWYKMDSEHFSDNEKDSRRWTNYLWLINQIDGPAKLSGLWVYGDHDSHTLALCVASRDLTGQVTIHEYPVIHAIEDAESYLADYPLLDEDKYNELEAEGYEEAWTEMVDYAGREFSNVLGWNSTTYEPWLLAHRDQFFEAGHEGDTSHGYEVPTWNMKGDIDDMLILASAGIPLTGYKIHHSCVADSYRRYWLVRSVMEPDGDKISGLLVLQDLRSKSLTMLEMKRDLSASEFMPAEGRSYIPTTEFSKLPGIVRLEIIRWLNEPDLT